MILANPSLPIYTVINNIRDIRYNIYYTSLAAAKRWFGRVWELQNSGVAAAQLGFATISDITYSIYYTSLAAAKLGLGSCQNLVWQLPNSDLAAANLGFGRCRQYTEYNIL
jgi:hypothetical protein